jgi:hypothetical protein
MRHRKRRWNDQFVFALIMATPCLAAGFAMTLARDPGLPRDFGWWGAMLASACLVVIAASGETAARRIWQSGVVMVVGVGLIAASGAWWAAVFVFCGTASAHSGHVNVEDRQKAQAQDA